MLITHKIYGKWQIAASFHESRKEQLLHSDLYTWISHKLR